MSEKRPIWLAIWALVFAVLLAVGSYVLGYIIADSRVIITTITPLTLAALFAFVAFWHSALVRREVLEKEDKERLRQEYDRDDLFGDADSALDLAADAHKNFDRWFLTSFTVITGLLVLVRSVFYYLGWLNASGTVERDALSAAGLSFFMLIFCLLAGTYYNGVSREKGCRFLRPVGNWFLFASFLYGVAFIVMLVERFNMGQWDALIARIIVVIIGFLAIEMIFNFIIEFYRPRLKGELERPLYESRILSVITEPGGIAKNVAHALDYQFGFKVSETWFYAFIERAVIPFAVILLVTLYLLECVVVIDSGHLGIRETFGKRSETLLQPGLRMKLPVPLQRVLVYPVDQVQYVSVGYVPYAEGEPRQPDESVPEEQMDTTDGRVILWNKHHYKDETHFLVPAAQAIGPDGTGDSRTVPVSFLSANVFVQYKVDPDRLFDYAYNYENPEAALREMIWREVVVFLANQDFVALLSVNYRDAQRQLDARIRRAVSQAQPSLGVQILYIGIAGAHPPVEVAADFQAVVAADIERYTHILRAEGAQQRQIAMAGAESTKLVADATAYANTKSSIAESEAQRFNSQLQAYEAAGQVFVIRTYLDVLESISTNARKYVIAAPNARHVQNFDFVERVRPDLQDVDLNAPEH